MCLLGSTSALAFMKDEQDTTIRPTNTRPIPVQWYPWYFLCRNRMDMMAEKMTIDPRSICQMEASR